MTGDVALNESSLGYEICAGDQYGGAGTNGWVRGGITFDISTLPGGILEFQARRYRPRRSPRTGRRTRTSGMCRRTT
ncbi:MAG: hypothetical protein V3V08_06275 [Nannocystaceae bacterium]